MSATSLKGLRTARLLFSLGLALAWSDPAAAAASDDSNVCERQLQAASASENVPIQVLYAVGLTETGRKGKLHPYALNIEGKTVFTASEAEAMTEFRAARKHGKILIDLGCMQINHHFHGSEFPSVEAMLDPELNVRYAARFLKTLYAREGSWSMAVARYHAGPNNNPAQKRYICAVIGNLVRTGLGNWTPASRKFCR